jgi:hypothetical protein
MNAIRVSMCAGRKPGRQKRCVEKARQSMKPLRTVYLFTILSAVACAQDSTRPDLRGVWHFLDPRNQTIVADFAISQAGDGVTIRWLPVEKPDIVMYEGTFESGAVIAGRHLDTGAPQENRWVPLKITVLDANHVQMDQGLILTKAVPRDAAVFNMLRRMSLEKLPAKPFDLNGTWSLQNGLQVSVTQNSGDTALKTARNEPFFRGRYTGNPLIGGEALRPEGPAGGTKWSKASLTVVDPDHLRLQGRIIYRFSNPAGNDVSCDTQNSNHVKDYYARLRGALAYSEKDYKAARCWLGIGADWGYAPAQSMLAALIIDGKDGTAPDYALAFDLASKSAENGNTAAQFQLAGMYQNGKGTQADPEKAKFWLQKAQQSEDFAKLRSAMTPEGLANGLGVVMGMVGSMVDFNLSMTPPSCFSRDVLGNRVGCK